MKTRRRSPQEKKALSYAKDRRNRYGENDKSSRKNIPRSKARAIRAVRRADKASLRVDPLKDDVLVKRPKPSWKKSPDVELGRILSHRDIGFDNDLDFDRRCAEEQRRFEKRMRALKEKG